MGFISNISSYYHGIKRVIISSSDNKHESVGFDGYSINQSDLNYPAEDAYITVSDLYAIVNKISRASRVFPWVLKLKKGDNEEIVKSSDNVYDYVFNPNPEQTNHDFREESLIFLLLNGNVFIDKNSGFGSSIPQEIRNLYPQITEIKTIYRDKIYQTSGYRYLIDGKEEIISKDEVSHVKYANPSMFGLQTNRGLSPVLAGYLTIKGLHNNHTAHASVLDNQGMSGILSNESEYALTKTEKEEQQKALEKATSGAEKFGKIMSSTGKVKYTKLGLDPTQLKIIEGKVLKMRDLCNIYDIPSTLFNDPINRIQSNVTPSAVAFWTNAVLPNDLKILEGYQKGILDPINELMFSNSGDGYYLEQDISAIPALQKDQKEEAEKDKIVLEAINVILQMNVSDEAKKLLLINELELAEDYATELSKSKTATE